MFSSLAFLLRFFWHCSKTLRLDIVDGVDIGVDVVSENVVESDEFGYGLDGGGFTNEELSEPRGPIETYLSVMTWLMQVVSVLWNECGGGVIFSLFLVLSSLLWVVDE